MIDSIPILQGKSHSIVQMISKPDDEIDFFEEKEDEQDNEKPLSGRRPSQRQEFMIQTAMGLIGLLIIILCVVLSSSSPD